MNVKQAYKKTLQIKKQIGALYDALKKIDQQLATECASFDVGDIISRRSPQTNALSYYEITDCSARFMGDGKLSLSYAARRCTKSGLQRGWGQYHPPEWCEHATLVTTAKQRQKAAL